MGMLRSFGAASAIALVACTVEGGDSDPFGASSAPSTSVTTLSSTTASSQESTSSDTGESGAPVSSDESSAGPGESSSGTADASSGSSEGDSTGGGSGGMQPADGMYSSCAVAMDCGVVPALCITITDMMMNPLGGFCSETGCANPAMSCDAAPGGTATPICMPVDVNGTDQQACALDCSGGKICPLPMACLPLADMMICA